MEARWQRALTSSHRAEYSSAVKPIGLRAHGYARKRHAGESDGEISRSRCATTIRFMKSRNSMRRRRL